METHSYMDRALQKRLLIKSLVVPLLDVSVPEPVRSQVIYYSKICLPHPRLLLNVKSISYQKRPTRPGLMGFYRRKARIIVICDFSPRLLFHELCNSFENSVKLSTEVFQKRAAHWKEVYKDENEFKADYFALSCTHQFWNDYDKSLLPIFRCEPSLTQIQIEEETRNQNRR